MVAEYLDVEGMVGMAHANLLVIRANFNIECVNLEYNLQICVCLRKVLSCE